MLGIMLGSQLLADVAQLQGGNRQALLLDAADDLAYQPARHTVGLDQYQGPFRHGAQRTEPRADQPGGDCPCC